MADYIRLAGVADAEAFDGKQTRAEALVAAYPDIMSIQQDEHDYKLLAGPNAYTDEDETGVTLGIVNVKAGDYDNPAVITIKVLTAASRAGTVEIAVRGEEPVSLVLAGTEDAPTIATAISILDFGANWTATIDAGYLVTLTENTGTAADAILAVEDENGNILNAYADDYIVFETPYEGEENTKIVSAADFAIWYTAVTP